MMTRFMQFLARTCPDHIRPADGAKWQGYGDWLNIRDDTPRDVLATAYFAYSTHLLARMAAVVGKTEDARQYEALFQQTQKAKQPQRARFHLPQRRRGNDRCVVTT